MKTPDLDDWATDEWWLSRDDEPKEKPLMAYEFEADEWRRATHTMTEAERAAATGAGRPAGVIGDRDDARDEIGGRR
ncbi:hypothetical protein SEA_JUNG_43 [Mycobacterium phage Jung]|uniref:Uncharacterized protein n=1 Tax=Mycobacterium phage Jung TaxID=2742107 RepID=A0AAE7F8K3_9CAUD|nr:hypothetical protein I5J41_gp43 [Mycobacterium phage Jung]QKY80203.1 hypothetical protein SEA_JUNG_43 [Mycobacterium phage Jung]